MSGDLTRRVVTGSLVKLLGSIPVQLVSVAATFLCVRILAPTEFGEYSLALAIYGFSDLFTNPGVATYLIRDKSCTDHAIDVAFTMSALRGVIITPILFFVGPSLATPLGGSHEVGQMLQLMSFSFLLHGLQNLHVIRFHQELRMGRVLLVESVGPFVGTAVGIALLVSWKEPLGLIVGSLIRHGINVVLAWAFAPRRARLVWDWSELQRLWQFSRFLVANSVIIFALLKLDDLMVGKLAGLAALGLYALSYDVVNHCLLFIVKPLQAVVLPAFAKVADDHEHLIRATHSVVSTFAVLSWMVCASLWMLPEDVVELLAHDSRWVEAAPVFRALLPFVLVRGINGAMGSLLLAVGKPNWVMRVSGSQLVLMIPLGVAGFLVYDFLGLVLAITLLNAGAMLALVIISARHIRTRVATLGAIILMPMPSGLAAVAASYVVHGWVQPLSWRLGACLGVSVTVFFVLWELTCRLPMGELRRSSLIGLAKTLKGPPGT